MEPGEDSQYERMHRRLARRAVFVSLYSVLAGTVLLLAGSPGPATAIGGDLTPASSLAPSAPDRCTPADLAKPRRGDMPIPEVVAANLVVHPDPDLERLSPPLSQPSVSAAKAWATAQRHGFGDPSSLGRSQILLGQLYASNPAEVRLVWAVYAAHQPEPGSASGPPCMFESTMFYVDATTGQALVGEVFAPSAVTLTA